MSDWFFFSTRLNFSHCFSLESSPSPINCLKSIGTPLSNMSSVISLVVWEPLVTRLTSLEGTSDCIPIIEYGTNILSVYSSVLNEPSSLYVECNDSAPTFLADLNAI